MRTACWMGVALALAVVTTPALAQERRVIRVVEDEAAGEFRYEPAAVEAAPGDILIFRMVSGGNHAVSFERDIPAEARRLLNQAMPGRVGELAGPLVAEGREYRIPLPAALPAGRYRFFCLPHRAYDEAGVVTVGGSR